MQAKEASARLNRKTFLTRGYYLVGLDARGSDDRPDSRSLLPDEFLELLRRPGFGSQAVLGEVRGDLGRLHGRMQRGIQPRDDRPGHPAGTDDAMQDEGRNAAESQLGKCRN